MISRLVKGAVAALGALGFTQFPTFYQQYLQRLGGRLDQSRIEVDRLRTDAEALGRTIDVYLDRLAASGTDEARQSALREVDRLETLGALENAYRALLTAGPIERPLAFAEHLNLAVAQDTLAVFEPAVPATVEALVYGALGALAALLVAAACHACARGLAHQLKARPA